MPSKDCAGRIRFFSGAVEFCLQFSRSVFDNESGGVSGRLPQPPTPNAAFSDLSGTEDSSSDQATSKAEPAAETEDRPAVGIVCCAHGDFW